MSSRDVRGERTVFGLYKSCGNMGSVGRVSVFGLRWCPGSRWWVWGGVALAKPWEGGVVLCLCVVVGPGLHSKLSAS